ncbi:hypothetical protein IB024_01225 [Brucella sp. 6810]|uniref:hypothetical protein n=1 Tax=Brucella sp. 6810 TaxID=2769351 RepID=UPI00165B545B|nr:hypothetical protein [Brucella sp. 6810]QNQ62412.1 hypothetical protein IB024_01225 [Brucella sp. 6810]
MAIVAGGAIKLIARGAFLSLFVLAAFLWADGSLGHNRSNSNVQGEDSTHSNPSDVFSIPVRIIPSPRSNENGAADAKAREESHRREDENLAIQRSIADSSKDIAHYTYLQIWLSLVTVGASVTAAWFAYGAVKEARQSTRIAQKELAVTEDTAKQQLRPYIVFDTSEIRVLRAEGDPAKILQLDIGFRNCGSTPAILTAASSSVYAPDGSGRWPLHESSCRPFRMVIGPNQTDKIRFKGVTDDGKGTFPWFTIGILVWYENLANTKFEDSFWLTYDGTGMRQDYHTSPEYALYRPSED